MGLLCPDRGLVVDDDSVSVTFTYEVLERIASLLAADSTELREGGPDCYYELDPPSRLVHFHWKGLG